MRAMKGKMSQLLQEVVAAEGVMKSNARNRAGVRTDLPPGHPLLQAQQKRQEMANKQQFQGIPINNEEKDLPTVPGFGFEEVEMDTVPILPKKEAAKKQEKQVNKQQQAPQVDEQKVREYFDNINKMKARTLEDAQNLAKFIKSNSSLVAGDYILQMKVVRLERMVNMMLHALASAKL